MVKKSKRQQEEEQPVPLKVLREKAGLSQVKLAALLGVDPSTLSKCERGLTEPSFTLEQTKILATVFGFSKISDLPDHLGRPLNGQN